MTKNKGIRVYTSGRPEIDKEKEEIKQGINNKRNKNKRAWKKHKKKMKSFDF